MLFISCCFGLVEDLLWVIKFLPGAVDAFLAPVLSKLNFINIMELVSVDLKTIELVITIFG